MKVFVITRNLVIEQKSSAQEIEELLNPDAIVPDATAPLCVVETEVVRIINNLDEAAHSYRVRWWARETYGSYATIKDFLATDVFFSEGDAFEELETRLQQMVNRARRKYVWTPGGTKKAY